MTEISLIFKMDRPDARIRNPPTMVISHIRFAVISGSSHCAKRKIEPCQQKSTTPASAMPTPNDDAKTIEVTKSSVALVSRKVSSP